MFYFFIIFHLWYRWFQQNLELYLDHLMHFENLNTIYVVWPEKEQEFSINFAHWQGTWIKIQFQQLINILVWELGSFKVRTLQVRSCSKGWFTNLTLKVFHLFMNNLICSFMFCFSPKVALHSPQLNCVKFWWTLLICFFKLSFFYMFPCTLYSHVVSIWLVSIFHGQFPCVFSTYFQNENECYRYHNSIFHFMLWNKTYIFM